jgi:hypothetical protein
MKIQIASNTNPIGPSAVASKPFSFSSGGGGGSGGGSIINFVVGGAQAKTVNIFSPIQTAPSTVQIADMAVTLGASAMVQVTLTITGGGSEPVIFPPVYGYDQRGSQNYNVRYSIKSNGVEKEFFTVSQGGNYSRTILIQDFVAGENHITVEQAVAGTITTWWEPNGTPEPFPPQPPPVTTPVVINQTWGNLVGVLLSLAP